MIQVAVIVPSTGVKTNLNAHLRWVHFTVRPPDLNKAHRRKRTVGGEGGGWRTERTAHPLLKGQESVGRWGMCRNPSSGRSEGPDVSEAHEPAKIRVTLSRFQTVKYNHVTKFRPAGQKHRYWEHVPGKSGKGRGAPSSLLHVEGKRSAEKLQQQPGPRGVTPSTAAKLPHCQGEPMRETGTHPVPPGRLLSAADPSEPSHHDPASSTLQATCQVVGKI